MFGLAVLFLVPNSQVYAFPLKRIVFLPPVPEPVPSIVSTSPLPPIKVVAIGTVLEPKYALDAPVTSKIPSIVTFPPNNAPPAGATSNQFEVFDTVFFPIHTTLLELKWSKWSSLTPISDVNLKDVLSGKVIKDVPANVNLEAEPVAVQVVTPVDETVVSK